MEVDRPYKITLSDQRRIKEILHGFKLARSSSQTDAESDSETNGTTPEETESDASSANRCLTCKCEILKREDQVEHYKGDWHRYNIKLKLLGQPAVSAEEFVDNSDLFSISGSDSDNEDTPVNVSSDENRKTSMSVLLQDSDENHDAQLDNRRPKLYFRNSSEDIVSVYKKVLYSRQSSDLDAGITKVAVDTLHEAFDKYWAVILLSAGHFAAGVFQGSKVVAHKTFHRYVVRAKRGVAQSLNDSMNRGSTAKSAGANLRRYNELQLEENIKSLLKSWKEDYIDQCSHIFLRIPNHRKPFFYGGKEAMFDVKDQRIRSVPFVTRRPTFNEVQRVHQELFSLTVHGKKSMTDIFSPPRPKSSNNNNVTEKPPTDVNIRKQDKTAKEELVEFQAGNEEDSLELTIEPLEISTKELEIFSSSVKKRNKAKKKKERSNGENAHSGATPPSGESSTPRIRRKSQSCLSALDQLSPSDRDIVNKLYTACKTSDLIAFNDCLNDKGDAPDNPETEEKNDRHTPCSPHNNLASLLSMGIDASGNTLLHVAAKSGHKHIIFKLLERGADPTVKNYQSFLPYCVCPNKEARNTFRKFRAKYPDLHDYSKAQVPFPLSDEKEAELKKKQAEKKKAQRSARKEKDRERRAEEEKRRAEQEEKERFLALSDREKRLIAVERRMKQNPDSKITHDRRCYLCGEDMFAKVPFEYSQFKFCSMKCLKQHKTLAAR